MAAAVEECFVCGGRESGPGPLPPVNGHRFIACSGCGMVTARPEGEGSPPAGYSDYHYGTVDDPAAIAARIDRLKVRLGPLFLWLRLRYGPGVRILDVGCGAGYAVAAGRSLGLAVEGVEPSEPFRRYAVERVGASPVHALPDQASGSFQAVLAFDVLEHLRPSESREQVGRMVARLSSGGMLAGTVPNLASWNVALSGRHDPSIAPPHHLCYFSPAPLRRYLVSLGARSTIVFSRGLNLVDLAANRRGKGDPGREATLARVSGRLPGRLAGFPLGIAAGLAGSGNHLYFAAVMR